MTPRGAAPSGPPTSASDAEPVPSVDSADAAIRWRSGPPKEWLDAVAAAESALVAGTTVVADALPQRPDGSSAGSDPDVDVEAVRAQPEHGTHGVDAVARESEPSGARPRADARHGPAVLTSPVEPITGPEVRDPRTPASTLRDGPPARETHPTLRLGRPLRQRKRRRPPAKALAPRLTARTVHSDRPGPRPRSAVGLERSAPLPEGVTSPWTGRTGCGPDVRGHRRPATDGGRVRTDRDVAATAAHTDRGR